MERSSEQEQESLNKVVLIQKINELQGVGTDTPSAIQNKALWDSAWLVYDRTLKKYGRPFDATVRDLEALVRLYEMALES